MKPDVHTSSERRRRAAPNYGAVVGLVLAAGLSGGCSNAASPDSGRPPAAEKWFRRAQSAFATADFDEAHDSVGRALAIVPEDVEARTLGAQTALTSLDYAETLRLLKGVTTTEAASLRGRAYWYKGELEAAADELDAMLNDPDVKDDWAKSVSKLARRGAGRTPFVLSGGLLAAIQMVRVSPAAPYFVVPIEIDGESALAMLATGTAEMVIDSATRPEPSWVSLRLTNDSDRTIHVEIHDVPALAQDLSGLSKEVGAPIKAMLGVNLLRHLNATMDYGGRQFVARSFAPPPPPHATRVPLHYVRGGGMVVRSAFGGEKGPHAALLVDTSKPFPVALDQEGWKKAGTAVDALRPIAGDPEQKLREGIVPLLRLGAFDVPRVQGIYGFPLGDLEKMMSVDIDGVVGAGLLYAFRCTFADEGRVLWIEDDSAAQALLDGIDQPMPSLRAPGAVPPLNERELPPPASLLPSAPSAPARPSATPKRPEK